MMKRDQFLTERCRLTFSLPLLGLVLGGAGGLLVWLEPHTLKMAYTLVASVVSETAVSGVQHHLVDSLLATCSLATLVQRAREPLPPTLCKAPR